MRDLLDSIFLSIKYSIKDIIILPGDNLDNTLKIACTVAGVSTLSHFLGLPTVLNWIGAWVGCGLLFIITLIGRRDSGEIPRSNGVDPVSVQADGSREQGAGTEGETQRV